MPALATAVGRLETKRAERWARRRARPRSGTRSSVPSGRLRGIEVLRGLRDASVGVGFVVRVALALACLLAVAPSTALAQAAAVEPPATEPSRGATEAQARALFERGLAAAEAGAHADALIHFERSFELVPRASTAFNVAVQHARLGRPTAALRALDSLHELSPSEADVRDAEALRGRLRASLATLVLRVDPASATVSVDGAVVPGVGAERTLVLDPGARRIEVRADDHAPSRRAITLLAGATAEERFDLVPSVSLEAREPAPEVEPQSRRARRVAIALTVVGVVAGAVALGAWLGRPDPLPRDSFPDL